jgi:hypothetical protein
MVCALALPTAVTTINNKPKRLIHLMACPPFLAQNSAVARIDVSTGGSGVGFIFVISV